MSARKPRWCDHRISRLRQMHAAGHSWQEIAVALQTSPTYAARKSVALGYHTPAPRARWTAEMDKMMRRHYRPGHASQLARVLGVSIEAVRARAYCMGITERQARPRHIWTPQQDAVLIAGYADQCTSAIASQLGLEPEQVRSRARRLGLRKSDAYRAQKIADLQPRAASPLGTIAIHDGVAVMKIISPASRRRETWISLPRALWIRAHGAIPPGHAVVVRRGFENTPPHDLTIDKIECMPRAALLQRNIRRRAAPKSAIARQSQSTPWTMRTPRPRRTYDFSRRAQ